MKFFGICCGRKNGNTELLMAEALNGVKERIPDAECSFVNLQEAEIRSCIGCETCMKHKLKGDLEFRCIHGLNEDHFYAIEQQMRAADGIIVSAPAYNLLPPGILIRFLFDAQKACRKHCQNARKDRKDGYNCDLYADRMHFLPSQSGISLCIPAHNQSNPSAAKLLMHCC